MIEFEEAVAQECTSKSCPRRVGCLDNLRGVSAEGQRIDSHDCRTKLQIPVPTFSVVTIQKKLSWMAPQIVATT